MNQKTTTRLRAALGLLALFAVGPPALAKDTYGPTRPGDSLWKIAGDVYRDEDITRHQAMLALLKANPKSLGSSCNVNAPLQLGAVLRLPPAAEVRRLPAEEARREVEQQTRDWKEHLRTGQPLVCAPTKPIGAVSESLKPAPPARLRAATAEETSPPPPSARAASRSASEMHSAAAAKAAVRPPAPEPAPKPKVPQMAAPANEPPQPSARPLPPTVRQAPGRRAASVLGRREFLVWLGLSMMLALLAVVLARRYVLTSTEADPGFGRQVTGPAAHAGRAEAATPPIAGTAFVGPRARRWAMGVRSYFRKMRGTTRGSPPRVSSSEMVWSWIGAFFGIGAVALLNQLFFVGTDLTLVIGSFGASAVLVYGAIRSPLAQPRNLVGGHVLSAVVGVVTWKLLQHDPSLAEAVAVATAIALMHATKTLHPPGGATALIAVIGSKKIHDLGFFYCLMPATVGPLILLAVAVLVNNIPNSRRYPETWF
ncbi:MAG: FimV/HubP family polar landmark protein [Chromatiaceae bacterium]